MRQQTAIIKVVSEADYKIPIREIENICESDLFNKAYKRLFVSPFDNPQIETDIKDALKELDAFLHAEPGDEINLSVNGLIQFGQFTKPTYKMIKKHTDGLREHMGEKLDNMDKELPVMIKSIKNKLWNSLDAVIARYIEKCGPYAAIDIIGAPTAGVADSTRGMMAEVKKLQRASQQIYTIR